MGFRLRHGTALLALACGLACAQDVAAQRGGRLPRSIRGQVINDQNRPVPWAYVSLQGEMGGVAATATTGPRGRFRFDDVKPDVYTVVAQRGGYHKAGQRVDLTAQFSSFVLLVLHPKKDTSQPPSPLGEPTVAVQSMAVPEDARAEFARGRKDILEEGDMESGAAHLREAIRLYPRYLEAHLLLGTSYIDQQEWEKGEQALRKALEINDSFAPGHFALATLHKKQGKLQEAGEDLKLGLRLDPDSWRGHLELAQILLSQKQVEEAAPHAERAHELNPESPLVHAILGNVRLRQWALDEAVAEYQHCLDREPEAPLGSQIQAKIKEIEKTQRQLARRQREGTSAGVSPAALREYRQGMQAVRESRLEEGLEHFQQAVGLASGFVQARHMVAIILMDRQEWDQAEKAIKRCLEINDGFAPAHLALGKLYKLQNRPQDALPELRRSVQLDPGFWKAHFELADSLVKMKEISKAKEHAEQAHEGGGADSPVVHLLLGNIGLMERNLRLARKEFQHYLDLAPNGSMAPIVRQKVRQISVVLDE